MGIKGAEKGRERERVEKWRPAMTMWREVGRGGEPKRGREERGESAKR